MRTIKKGRVPLLLLILVMVLVLSSQAFAVGEGNGGNGKEMLQFSDLAAVDAGLSKVIPLSDAPAVTQQEAVSFLLRLAGLKESGLGTYPNDYNSMAKSIGMLEGFDYEPLAECSMEIYELMLKNLGPLMAALNAKPMSPFFVNGSAQPIFPLDEVVRFCVYVESDYDCDEDGKLDLIKVIVQLPKPALEGMKVASVYEAIPYSAGTNPQTIAPGCEAPVGSTYDVEKLYTQNPARTPVGEATTAEHAAKADSKDWIYYYGEGSGNPNCYQSLHTYDYYLVRGFAIVQAAGRGTMQSEGFSTCGADVEIDAYRSVIEWLAGDRVAYTDKTSNIQIKADWSNGSVGMTGTSYGGTTQFGLANTGVKGLKTIVPVAGIASWYEYTNTQGTYDTLEYTQMLAWYVNSRYRNDGTTTTDYENSIKTIYGQYLRQLRTDQANSTGDYMRHWMIRDYTSVEAGPFNWENIKCSALIVHGTNDDNVRTKQSDLMFKAFTKAEQPVKILLHQGTHMTPTRLYTGDLLYNELLNKWFCHFLYDVDNGIENIPTVTAESNIDGTWQYYDDWASDEPLVVKHINPSQEPTTTINSYYSSHSPAITSSNFRNYFTAASTPHSALYTIAVPEDLTIKGSVAVHIKAAPDNYTPPTQAAIAQSQEIRESTEWDIYLKDGVLDWDAVRKGLDEGLIDDNVVMMLMRDYGSDSSDPDISSDIISRNSISDDVTPISRGNNLVMSAMLVDISDSSFNIYAGPSTSSTSLTTLQTGGIWMGGGIQNTNLSKIAQTAATRNTVNNTYYKVIAYGRMDLYNPDATYYSNTAGNRVDLVPGQFYDYTLYLQPNLYTVAKGHTLALVIFAYYPGKGAGQPTAAQGQYSITIDNARTFATIPVDELTFEPEGNLRLKTDGHLVQTGDYFRVTPYFKEAVRSNTAILDFTFDKAKFEYRGYTPADGVTLLERKDTDNGVRLTVMVSGYNTTTYGDLLFSARDNADLKNEDNEISVEADYVVMLGGGVKEVVRERASTIFTTTYGNVGPFDPNGITLLTLSNIIDVFGLKNGQPGWSDWRFFDFNNNGEIDIYDVTQIAQKIKK